MHYAAYHCAHAHTHVHTHTHKNVMHISFNRKSKLDGNIIRPKNNTTYSWEPKIYWENFCGKGEYMGPTKIPNYAKRKRSLTKKYMFKETKLSTYFKKENSWIYLQLNFKINSNFLWNQILLETRLPSSTTISSSGITVKIWTFLFYTKNRTRPHFSKPNKPTTGFSCNI